MKFIMSFIVITFSMVQVSKGVRPRGHSHHHRGSNQGSAHSQGFAVGCGDDADFDEPQTDGGGEISFGGRKSLGSGEEICGRHDGPECLEGHHSHHHQHHHQHHHHHCHHHHHHPLAESKREVEEDGAEDEVRKCIKSGCHHHHHHHHRHPARHSGSPSCHESDDEEEDIRHPLPPTKGLLRKGAFRRK